MKWIIYLLIIVCLVCNTLGQNTLIPKIVAWGDGVVGTNSSNPTVITTFTLDSLERLSIGGIVSHAFLKDGTLLSWGSNAYGSVGNNNTAPVIQPVSLTSPNSPLHGINIIHSAVGNDSQLVISDNGTVYSWGNNNHNQLGTNETTWSSFPIEAPLLSGLNMTSIVCGIAHCIALNNRTMIYSWGWNNWCQVGVCSGGADVIDPVVPDGIITTKTIKQLVLMGEASIALTEDGQVFTVGYRDYVGANFANVPFFTPIYNNITSIVAGSGCVLMLSDFGSIYGFGSNFMNNILSPTGVYFFTPIPVWEGYFPNGTVFSEIYATKSTAYGLTTDGLLYYWGTETYNGSLQYPSIFPYSKNYHILSIYPTSVTSSRVVYTKAIVCDGVGPVGAVCYMGNWVYKGPVVLDDQSEAITITSQITIEGPLIINTTQSKIEFVGLDSYINVTGPIILQEGVDLNITVELSSTDVDQLTDSSTRTLFVYNTISSSDLSGTNTMLVTAKSCKKTSAKPDTAEADGISKLVLLFSVNSSSCTKWWIILASVAGGIVLIVLILIIIWMVSSHSCGLLTKFRVSKIKQHQAQKACECPHCEKDKSLW